MSEVIICVGSSCHLKGAKKVVESLTKLVKERNAGDTVKLSGSFCMGQCEHPGVSVKVNGAMHFVTPEETEKFFNDVVMGGKK